jgi:hypothetical protein
VGILERGIILSSYTIATIGLAFLAGCDRSEPGSSARGEMQALKVQLDSLRSGIEAITTTLASRPNQVLYHLQDLARSKVVGNVWSDATIGVGDRVFLGDDIWEVKYVKLFMAGKPTDVNEQQYFSLGNIQLLVSFGGKATEPNKPK